MTINSNAFKVLGLAAACGLCLGAVGLRSALGGDLIASSQGDFSSTQGQSGWSYGYYTGTQTPAGFVAFPTFASARNGWERNPSAWAGQNPGYFCTITANGGHPHAVAGSITEVNSAVRRWVSTYSGSVLLQGTIQKTSTFFSGVQDGITGRIFVGGVEVFAVAIPATDGAPRTFSIPTCLSVGTVIDAVIDPNANEFSDGADFSINVAANPVLISGGPLSSTTCPNGITAFGVNVTNLPIGNSGTYRWQIQALAGGAWTDIGSQPVVLDCPAGGGGGEARGGTSSTATLLLRVRPCSGGSINAAAPTTYGVRCIVGDGCGTITSNVATFTVCPADFNCSSNVTVQDVFDFLSAWFAGDVRADINLAGGVTVQDVFDFLGAWFQGCGAI